MNRRVAGIAALAFALGCMATVAYTRHPKIDYDALAREAAVALAPPGFGSAEAPKNDRFQIIQSPFMARLTFKLDSYTGDVWHLVVDKNQVVSWETVPVSFRAKTDPANAPRFQIFLSSVLAKNTFLADLQTGQTWVLVSSKESGLLWDLMASSSQ